ncbi:MAG: YabP/YqfC family sporulation protein [Clostridia bacterium]|nr:YabP/YqfC family sporulation protein [Clostridia bacterium]
MAHKRKRKKYSMGKATSQKVEKVADMLDISKDFLAGSLKVTIIANCELTVEGEISILEYTDTSLKLNTRSFIFGIKGSDFEITQLDTDYLRLVGNILATEYMV